MGKLKGTTGGGGPKASRAQAAAHKQKVQKAAILAKLAVPEAEDAEEEQVTELSNPLKQALLNVFSDTLADTLASPELHDALQALKKALFDRDFDAAFGGDADKATEANGNIAPLDAYASRWSPTRALCYGSVLVSPVVQDHWNPNSRPKKVKKAVEGVEGVESVESVENVESVDVAEPVADENAEPIANSAANDDDDNVETPIDDSPLRMVAIGGGAAEVVAFASLLASDMPCKHRMGKLVLIDSAPWASVVGRLNATMTTPVAVPTMDGVEEERVLVGPAERLAVDVRQLDILEVGDDDMAKLIAGDSDTVPTKTLVTLFFTLNELFTQGGLGAAATFLLRLTNAAPAGTVLLVVDSPGSYAETAVGSHAKKYPMKWLLDRFLTQDAGAWSKVHEDDSTWFRLTSALTYPIRLEDMRYQTHIYTKL